MPCPLRPVMRSVWIGMPFSSPGIAGREGGVLSSVRGGHIVSGGSNAHLLFGPRPYPDGFPCSVVVPYPPSDIAVHVGPERRLVWIVFLNAFDHPEPEELG